MLTSSKFRVIALMLGLSLSSAVKAQDCVPPNLKLNDKTYNILSPEQEMILGDLTYQKLSGGMRFIREPELVAYIGRIGERLVKHLPSVGLKFQFFIIDIPEANAFDVPGGYIFVSRKLIALANSEDELAGVIGHELGHAVVHQGAQTFSERLKRVLNVTQLGDRKDIAEKYNLLIERRNTKDGSRKSSEESEAQQLADRIGLFAVVAAGYDPTGLVTLFDRLTEAKGKTGSWFSDLFGTTRPEEKRLREMIKVNDRLPATCRESRQANGSEAFLNWQAAVVSFHDTGGREQLTGLFWRKELSPKLRSDLFHFAFSSDGKYLLAQDDFAITIIQREPLKVLFQVPSEEAEPATFTPDGQFVVFGTENLRLEKWSIAEQKPVVVRELVVRHDCWEHAYSPDGNFLACVDYELNLKVIDTSTGKKVFEKKNFYELSYWEWLTWTLGLTQRGETFARNFFNIQFSPDSHFLLVSRSHHFRSEFQPNNALLALDLNELSAVKVGGDLSKVAAYAFLFLDSNRILGMASRKLDDSGIFSFPDGRRLDRFPLGAEQLIRTANPNYVIIKPLEKAKLGVFELNSHALVAAMNKADVTIWNDQAVYEGLSGQVLLAHISNDAEKKAMKVSDLTPLDIPVSSLGALYAAEVADNMQWLAVSSRSRGAVWDLASGERKMYLRGFRGFFLTNDGGAIAEFPRQDSVKHTLALLNPVRDITSELREIPDRANQFGRFILVRKSLKATNKQTTDKKDRASDKSDDSDETGTNERLPLTREVRFELHDVINDKLIWARDFSKEAPAFFFDYFSGRLIFLWQLSTDVGKNRLKEDPQLAERAKELSNVSDDYLIEVVDAFAAKTVGTVLLDTGKRSFYPRWGISEGDWMVLNDSENRILVYSLKDGELHQRFFGTKAAVSPSKSQIVIENYPGELTFYDMETGDSQGHLSFTNDAALVRYSLDGKKLFVLSKTQTAYVFDLERVLQGSTIQTR